MCVFVPLSHSESLVCALLVTSRLWHLPALFGFPMVLLHAAKLSWAWRLGLGRALDALPAIALAASAIDLGSCLYQMLRPQIKSLT
jgi:hypothetical protein